MRLYKPSSGRNDPYDQSGARVWSRTASGVGRNGTPGCNLALAWGQDPRRASAAAPGLDVGTSIPPLRLIEGTKSLALKTDNDSDGVLSPGDIATYNITIKNTGAGTVSSVKVYDAAVPANTVYVASSTAWSSNGTNWTSIADVGGTLPLAQTGGVLLGDLAAGATFYVRFDVTLNNLSGGVYEELRNCDIAYTGGGDVQSCATNLVASNDWGDLPDTYGTSLAANGPRHSYSGLTLGSNFDRELQGQPSTGANGDDLSQTTPPKADDEDGIVIGGGQPAWQSGGTGSITVTVAGGDGCLNAWMDFTNDSGATPPAADGNFTKAAGGYDTYSTYSEYIIQNAPVSAGTSTINVTVPPGAIGAAGAYFRFRLSPRACTTAVAPTGFVTGGEVEDYRIIPADLSVTKTDGLTTVAPGSTLVYTLVVKNNGSSLATGVTLSDTIGANLSYSSSTCPGTPTQNGSTYTWTLADLAPGQSTSCTVTVLVASPLADGVQLNNYARVSTTALEVNITDNEVSDIDTVKNVDLPDLRVTKSDGNTQVLAGDTLVYTILYGNAGTVGATGVSIVDVLPANVTYQSSNPAGSLVGSTLTWSIGPVAAGGSGSVQVTVKVNNDQLAGAIVLNHVSIDGAENDKNPADDSASDSDTVIAPYVVTEKSASGPDPVTGEVTYSIYWYNNSTATAANVQVQDTLPANTTLVPGSITGGGIPSGGVITWNLGNQPPGASGTVSFRVTLGAGAGSATQTVPTLSTETGSGSVTVASRITAYPSLPWCDSTFSSGRCLRYAGLYQDTNSIGPAGWNENPRATDFNDTAGSWGQPIAASTREAYYWLPASTLDAEWTSRNTTGLTYGNYTFFRQAFCLPLNASNLDASLRLASDDISTVYLNGISVGQHIGAGGYSTLTVGTGIQSGINILAIQLLNNRHNGHPFGDCPGCDHSGLLFNLQASYGSLRPFAYAPATTLEDQSVTFTADETALGGRKPFMYMVSWGDGTADAPYQSGATFTHTYANPGTYVATVTARAAYGCTGTDQVTIQVLPAGSNLLANPANVTYNNGAGVNYSGQTGAGLLLAGAVGDRIWLDEDGDGIQDAGEAGIANVKVTLTNGSQTYTTYTDANGNYVFANVPVGSYTVSVDPNSMPAGLAANRTYDEDGTGTPNTTSVTVTAGGEHMTADFGYNWAPSSDVTGNTGTGAIGDRVWIDADGDGVQDAEEMGLSGVTVELVTAGPDGLFGTSDDVVAATTTTNATGNYIFDGLPAGAYVVRVTNGTTGYTQTGDPDQPGIPCTACDAKTTAPIVLAPGDVYVNADFGYLPDTGMGATIGDTVWLDANTNGTPDGTEGRIAGVTVALIKDDGDGVYEPGIDLIIATDVTDANGYYQFNGVPVADGVGTDDYLVWVNDAHNVLGGLAPTYDNDGTATPNISAVRDLAPDGNQLQDFGYAPAGQTTGEGLIGDTIFLDRNGNSSYDVGEGLEGVTVLLYADSNGDGNYDAGEALVAQTTTDENGNYYFGNLPAGNYVVVVDTTTLPGGLTNTIDPDTTDSPLHEAGMTLAAGEINLAQDFGYQGTNSVSGTIWEDTDADGFMDGTETGWLAGVTVVLRDSNGDIVATTTTDEYGNYSFTNLPNGTYTVDVTDEHNVLDGYWHSDGPNDGQNNNSQPDPYTVTVANGQTNDTADFGYYRDPAALGNWVWRDLNGNGIQDAGEPPVSGVTVKLLDANGNPVKDANGNPITTTTDANGKYEFPGLPPGTYRVQFVPPPGYVLTPPNQGTDPARDSNPNQITGITPPVTLAPGEQNPTVDAGLVRPTVGRVIQLPVIQVGDGWETWVQAQNVGITDTKFALLLFGQSGPYCGPQCQLPAKIEFSGRVPVGGTWSYKLASANTFTCDGAPFQPTSGILVSLSMQQALALEFLNCTAARDAVWQLWRSWMLNGTGPEGEPVAASVNRIQTGAGGTPRAAAYTGIANPEMETGPDPRTGAYMYYAPQLFDTFSPAGWTSRLWIQNSGIECTSLEVWFQKQQDCLKARVQQVLALCPGETIAVDPEMPGFLGSAWIRASQPLGVIVDEYSAKGSILMSYRSMPAGYYMGDTLGSRFNYAPLIYREFNGWNAGIVVQNLSSVYNALIKVYFLDNSGDIIDTIVEWICPRGSQTFYLSAINRLPGMYVGQARVESQNWWGPGNPPVDAPNVLSVVNLVNYNTGQGAAYNTLPAQQASTIRWVALPLLVREKHDPYEPTGTKRTSEIALTDLDMNPHVATWRIDFFDQNGLLYSLCQTMNEKQVDYIKLDSIGVIPPGWLGSAVISWQCGTGGALGVVVVEKTSGYASGDLTETYEGSPLVVPPTIPGAALCPACR